MAFINKIRNSILFLYSVLTDALFPDVCIYCSRILSISNRSIASFKPYPVCDSCKEKKLKSISFSGRCKVCLSFLDDGTCPFCRQRQVYFDRFVSLYYYNKEGMKFLKELKFKSRESLSAYLINPVIRILREDEYISTYLNNNSLRVMEVPMSFVSFRRRGFSQLEKIKDAIQREWDLEAIRPLIKISKPSQHFKNRLKRALEIQGSFRIKKAFKKKLSGNILLLDDIFTTGTTVNEIARILKNNGVQQVFVLSYFYRDLNENSN